MRRRSPSAARLDASTCSSDATARPCTAGTSLLIPSRAAAACIPTALTWCEIVSCRSRAIDARSSATARVSARSASRRCSSASRRIRSARRRTSAM